VPVNFCVSQEVARQNTAVECLGGTRLKYQPADWLS